MSEHTPQVDEYLLRLQVEASTWDINELTRDIDLLEDQVEFHREEAAQLRVLLRRAEEALADRPAPMPVGDGLEGLEEGVAA